MSVVHSAAIMLVDLFVAITQVTISFAIMLVTVSNVAIYVTVSSSNCIFLSLTDIHFLQN